jgi:hypothetical protein
MSAELMHKFPAFHGDVQTSIKKTLSGISLQYYATFISQTTR